MTIKRRRRRASAPQAALPAQPVELAKVIETANLTPEERAAIEAAKPSEQSKALDQTASTASGEAPAPRRRRASVGGHAMKLARPSRPGYTRRFFNDDGNRIAKAEELGYTPVTDTTAKSPGLGSLDAPLVGTKGSGEPLRAIHMETPDELYAEGVAEREAINSQVDQAIVKGADFTDQVKSEDGAYGRGSIQVER